MIALKYTVIDRFLNNLKKEKIRAIERKRLEKKKLKIY